MLDRTDPSRLPVVVLGGGPVGLAAGAHLADRGLPFVVLEAGPAVGAAVREWGHVRTFTPWRYLVDPTAERLLRTTGWSVPTTPVPPTGDELVHAYLEPLAAVLGERVRLGARVTAVSREGVDKGRSLGREQHPFVVRTVDTDGRTSDQRAAAVLDATGTWRRPNPLGASGLPAVGEQEAAPYLTGPLPDVLGRDRARFAGRRTLVVGAGHSAAGTLLALGRLAQQEPGTEIVWAVRGPSAERTYGGGAADELAERGRLGSDLRALVSAGAVQLVTGFSTVALVPHGATVAVHSADGRALGRLHTVVPATGFRPDLSVLSELRLDLDPGLEAPRALGPLVDPAWHSCGTVPPHGHRELAHPEPGLYVVGMKSYGRAPTFLVTTGHEQVRSVVAALAGDLRAADEVQLVLPETGVCSVDARGVDTAAGGCCGTATEVGVVPAEAHAALAEDVRPQGFPTGVAGGGRAAALALAEVGSTGGGCCTA